MPDQKTTRPLPCADAAREARGECCGGTCWGKVDYVCPDCGAPNSWHTRDCPSDTQED
jgi:rubredoxin